MAQRWYHRKPARPAVTIHPHKTGSRSAAADVAQSESERLLARARDSVAGGASSTMRVLDYHLPLVVRAADGAWIEDADGNRLIDLNMGYGPLILGHRHPLILDAIRSELDRRGTVLGFPHELSHNVAELVRDAFPSIDCLRFTSSGTEAGQTAVRLARAFTGRDRVVVFEGHYHGSSDALFHRYHAPLAELDARSECQAIPGTGGMGGQPSTTHVLPWNDADRLEQFLARRGAEVAAIVMEPAMGNAGIIPPRDGYLQAVRELADRHGIVLVFDEVITGFRIARGGAQERFGVRSDLTMLSKALGGGMPIAAIGGRRDILELMIDGSVFHGGVYSGNPVCLAAALATQRHYATDPDAVFGQLESVTTRLASGVRSVFRELGIPVVVQHLGAMLSLWFMRNDDTAPIFGYRELAQRADFDAFVRFQHALQHCGVYVHPNHHECWFPSLVHTPAIIDEILDRVATAARRCGHFE